MFVLIQKNKKKGNMECRTIKLFSNFITFMHFPIFKNNFGTSLKSYSPRN